MHALRFGLWILILCCAPMITGCGEKPPPKATERVEALMGELAHLDYDKAIAHFDPKLKQTYSRERLVQNWNALLKVRGEFKDSVVSKSQKVQGIEAVTISCEFEKGIVRVRATVNPDGTLGSLTFLPINH